MAATSGKLRPPFRLLLLLLAAAVARSVDGVELTLLTGAREKGAVCLDGSPPGYHLQRGFGSGEHSWFIHLQGGAWCNTIEDCSKRKMSAYGSSKFMRAVEFNGILSNDQQLNSDFYNWNRVFIRYCDGASFSGDGEAQDQDGSTLHFRGLRIWEAVINELMGKGLATAKQVTRQSFMIHWHSDQEPCQRVIRLDKNHSCFIGTLIKNHVNEFHFSSTHFRPYSQVALLVVWLHYCTAMIFMQDFLRRFQLNAFLMLDFSLILRIYPGRGTCGLYSMELFIFRNKFVDDIEVVKDKKDWGLFIDSCFTHCQTPFDISWNSQASPVLGNKTVAEAIGDWYFERSYEVKEIDCEYPEIDHPVHHPPRTCSVHTRAAATGEMPILPRRRYAEPLLLLLLAAVARSTAAAPDVVELILLTGAQEKGAVCLDGSPPGYHLQRGFGSGEHSWLIYLEGGAWCDTIESCSNRKTTELGSSKLMEAQEFEGILSNNQTVNSDFYNWNKVFIRYCDGASFSGNAEAQDQDGSTLHFRGLRIWQAVLDELMEKGLASAKQALLSGCSAGGLATLLHCNDFHARFPKEVSAKCLPDAGIFLDILCSSEDLSGKRLMWSVFNGTVQLQNVSEVLPKDCLAKKDRTECFLATELVKSITAPTLIVNSAYDSWQIRDTLAPVGSYPGQSWLNCTNDIGNCNSTQMEVLNGFRKKFVDGVKVVKDKKDWGLFIDSCFMHCQTKYSISWSSQFSPVLGNMTIAKAVGDWYFERSKTVKEIDCDSKLRSPVLPRRRLAEPFLLLLLLLLLAAVARPTAAADVVELTLLAGAQEKGAVCLDGSPPGYHLQRGFGSGEHSWLVFLEGGAWCNSIESCSRRKMGVYGSSKFMKAAEFNGILSNDQQLNSDFYNWNKVAIRYCDGASFSGDAEAQDKDGSTLHFRGLRIWEAVVDELMGKGLATAKQAILSGCSAGGLAALLHCNDFHARFPKEVSAKCLPDAGFFLDVEDLSGERHMWSVFNGTVHLQNVREVLSKDCLTKKDPTECFFPAELVKSITAPTLILNSAYDSWQMDPFLDSHGPVAKLTFGIAVPHKSKNKFVDDVEIVKDKKDWGLFIDSCFTHCQTPFNISWSSQASPVLGSKTVAEAVGDWYFERSYEVKEIDCEYPCNPTCSSQLPT
uniref:Pectin acetylesterase n=1 Tax=Oryza glumipatula TaxID=40148 RepID=A0A0D9YII3_9ORYZ